VHSWQGLKVMDAPEKPRAGLDFSQVACEKV
jgi:hypothetical protein